MVGILLRAGIALRFADAGTSVVVHYRGGESGAYELVDTVEGSGGQPITVQVNLSDRQAVVSGSMQFHRD